MSSYRTETKVCACVVCGGVSTGARSDSSSSKSAVNVDGHGREQKMTCQTVRAWSALCLAHPVAQRMFVCPELRDKETGTIYWILPRIQNLHFAFVPGKLISVHAGLLILHTNRENVEPHCAVFITHHSPLQRAKWCLQCSTLNSPQSNTTRNNFVIITKKSQVNPRKRQKAATNSRRNSRSLAKAISTILYPQRRDDVNCKT